MPTPTLVQSTTVASSAAAPATFTANYGGATTAGNLLVAIVGCALSGAGSVSTPTNWTAVASAGGSSTAALGAIYMFPNAPSLTAVAFTTLTAVNGIVVALFEFSNGNITSHALDADLGSVNLATSASASSGPETPTIGNEIWLGYIAFLSTATISAPNNTPGAPAWTTGTAATSTLGATNVTLQPYYNLPGPVQPGAFQIAATLSGSVAWVSGIANFQSNVSAQLRNSISGLLVTGGAGYAVGSM